MKSPLRYQSTSYDCGTTSFVNALMFLLDREDIPPLVVQYVTAHTCDLHYGPQGGPGGTSFEAMAYLCGWLNDYAAETGMPVRCKALRGDEVHMGAGSPLVSCLEGGGAVVTSCWLGVNHYVLLTGMEGDVVRVFDSYYDSWPSSMLGDHASLEGVKPVYDEPFCCTCKVERWVLDAPEGTPYSLAARSGKEAFLFIRTDGESATGQPDA